MVSILISPLAAILKSSFGRSTIRAESQNVGKVYFDDITSRPEVLPDHLVCAVAKGNLNLPNMAANLPVSHSTSPLKSAQ
jgi:hypothetical protein